MSVPYREGQFFLLPLDRDHFATGLIARVPRRGGVLLGYFFGPRRTSVPGQEWLDGLRPHHAVFVCRFKDQQLYRGEWRLLSVREPFERGGWPVPAFHRFDGTATQAPGIDAVQHWRVEYADDNLITPVRERAADSADQQLPEDFAFDAGLLAHEVGKRVRNAIPSADDTTWR
ncbi:MAG: Imm26 family immunity protein [Steroidobacteraceae bacterium]|jgi:hypothetical protein|nr:Imm26 family immunity protein [Steroidobacteraceae bacterium]